MAIRELTTLPDDIPDFKSDDLYFNDKSETPDALNKALVWQFSQSHGADIASAVTLNLDAGAGDLCDVTGTTGITAITLTEGRKMWVRFTGALTLTHSASLILPTAANITTAAGDFACFRGYAAGVVRCVSYQRASGAALAGGSGLAVGNAVSGGGANRVLYEDGSQNLAASANMTYGAAASQLKLTAGAASDNPFLIKLAASQSGDAFRVEPNGSTSPYFQINNGIVTMGDQSNLAKTMIIRELFANNYSCLINGNTTQDVQHYGFATDGNATLLNGFTALDLRISNSAIASIDSNGLSMNGKYIEGTEQTAPSAPAVNKGRIYFEDNGSGKTRLMVLFNTGAAQQIAIEP